MATPVRINGQSFPSGSLGDSPQSIEAGVQTQRDRVEHKLLDLVGAVRMLSETVEELVERRLQREIVGERLSRSQWKLLEIFALADVGNVTDLASYQGVSTAAASKAVDRLVRLGLLTRTEDPDDRRHIRLALSTEGRQLISTYLDALEAGITRLFPNADAAEVHQVGALVEGLVASSTASRQDLERACSQIHLTRCTPCVVEQRMGGACAQRMLSRTRARIAPDLPTTA